MRRPAKIWAEDSRLGVMSKWELEGARSGSGQAQIMKGPVGHEIKFGFYSGWQGKNLEVSCLCFECGEK